MIPDYINDEKLKKMKFVTVSNRKFKITNMVKGISEFFPVTFDTMHFSALNIVIHSVLMGINNDIVLIVYIDFKFR
jgi:hypothetical protein